jgi:D-aminopeptidase
MLDRISPKTRARDLGIPFDGTPGPLNAITFLAFSTANAAAVSTKEIIQLTMVPNEKLDPIFDATVAAVEEAIVNAMVAAVSMTGRDNHKAMAIPHDRLCMVMKKYGR